MAGLRCTKLWLRRCTAARPFAPLVPAHGFAVAPCSRYFHSKAEVNLSSSYLEAQAFAKKLVKTFPKLDPSHMSDENLEKTVKKIPEVDFAAWKEKGQPKLETVVSIWKELYEDSCFEDLLDSEMDIFAIKPDLQRKNSEELKLYEASKELAEGEVASPMHAAKQAKALRFEQFAKDEEEALMQSVIGQACENVDRKAAAKIAEINANAQRLIKEVESDLAAERGRIIASLKEKGKSEAAAAESTKSKGKAESVKEAKGATPKREGRPKWGDSHKKK